MLTQSYQVVNFSKSFICQDCKCKMPPGKARIRVLTDLKNGKVRRQALCLSENGCHLQQMEVG